MAKNRAAVALGRLGGKAKVPKGFAMLSPERRAEVQALSAAGRWPKKRAKKA